MMECRYTKATSLVKRAARCSCAALVIPRSKAMIVSKGIWAPDSGVYSELVYLTQYAR